MDEVEERIINLFSLSESADLAEQDLDAQVSAIARSFLRSKTVSSGIQLQALVERFRESAIPSEPSDAKDYLDYLADNVVAHSTRTSSPKFIGHMTSALPHFVRPLGKLMAALNQNVVKMETAKAFSPYERQAIAMVHRLIYNFGDDFYDQHIQRSDSTLGMIVSGGTLANITALWCARNARLGPIGGFTGVEREGLALALQHHGYTGASIIGSALLHYSIDKAADLLGIGARSVVRISTDSNSRVDIGQMERAVEDCLENRRLVVALVGVAGTTDCGAVDSLNEIAELARAAGTHFHVDAAWGGPVLFSRNHRHKLAGIERADSVTIDGHKQMYLPMGIGMVLMRNPQTAKVIEKQARYVVRAGSHDLGKRALEGSRPGMALFLHAALNIIGKRGYEFLIDEGIRKTQYLADQIRTRPEFELLVEPEINILTYRFIPQAYREKLEPGELTNSDDLVINHFNERLQKMQRQQGRGFVSRTTLDTTRRGNRIPVVALRAVIANPLTTESDIDSVLDDQLALAAELQS